MEHAESANAHKVVRLYIAQLALELEGADAALRHDAIIDAEQHLNAAIAAEYLVAVNSKPKVIAAASVDLITIGRNMHRRFDALPHLAAGIDVVIIENQMSTLATRMKTLQGMITQYFIMRGVPDIRFISATNKLKLFSEEGGGDKEGKDDYADRKKRSIEITRALINNAAHMPMMAMQFVEHKKKDDLADCFLQGLWWLCKGR